jgi:membrane-bound lytic murein transglycosylase B
MHAPVKRNPRSRPVRQTPGGKGLARAALLLAMILSLLLPPPAPASGEKDGGHFLSLQQRLVRDGFHAAEIDRLYSKPDVAFETEGVSLFFMHSEARLNYDQFTTEAQIQSARSYMDEHRSDLANAEKIYGVNPRIITAILLVETQLGRLPGNRSILNTLSTMASLEDRSVRETFWDVLPGDTRLSRAFFEEKADKKSAWAYRELKAFIRYTGRENIDPTKIFGSYAGAMGISQFMPSNILTLARDGNRDGRIDLFTHSDAIASVANYLRHHGWRPGLTRDQAYKVILRYNYSRYYANTILKIAKRLES